jgi:transcriptional regulator with XRE-family HTH domain
MKLSEQLEAWRKRLGMTQKAAAAHLGVSVRTLENWSQGRCSPKGFALKSLIEKMSFPAPGKKDSTPAKQKRSLPK